MPDNNIGRNRAPACAAASFLIYAIPFNTLPLPPSATWAHWRLDFGGPCFSSKLLSTREKRRFRSLLIGPSYLDAQTGDGDWAGLVTLRGDDDLLVVYSATEN